MTCTCPLCRPALVRSPLASLPGWDIAERIVAEQHNAAVLSNIKEREQWRDTEEVRG